jgi:hypothetical protein
MCYVFLYLLCWLWSCILLLLPKETRFSHVTKFTKFGQTSAPLVLTSSFFTFLVGEHWTLKMPRGIPNAKRDDTGMRYTTFNVPLPSVLTDRKVKL